MHSEHTKLLYILKRPRTHTHIHTKGKNTDAKSLENCTPCIYTALTQPGFRGNRRHSSRPRVLKIYLYLCGEPPAPRRKKNVRSLTNTSHSAELSRYFLCQQTKATSNDRGLLLILHKHTCIDLLRRGKRLAVLRELLRLVGVVLVASQDRRRAFRRNLCAVCTIKHSGGGSNHSHVSAMHRNRSVVRSAEGKTQAKDIEPKSSGPDPTIDRATHQESTYCKILCSTHHAEVRAREHPDAVAHSHPERAARAALSHDEGHDGYLETRHGREVGCDCLALSIPLRLFIHKSAQQPTTPKSKTKRTRRALPTRCLCFELGGTQVSKYAVVNLTALAGGMTGRRVGYGGGYKLRIPFVSCRLQRLQLGVGQVNIPHEKPSSHKHRTALYILPTETTPPPMNDSTTTQVKSAAIS